MATQISASQISTNTSSWYQRLRTIQGKTPTTAHGSTMITKTTDPALTSGTAATAAQINSLVNAINGLQSNVFLSYANWSSYKPSTVSQNTLISSENTYTKINNMLSSLESINANYSTYGEYNQSCPEYTQNATNTNCPDYSNQTNYVTNTNYSTDGDNTTNTVNSVQFTSCSVCGTDSYDGVDGEDGQNGYNGEQDICSEDDDRGTCSDDSDEDQCYESDSEADSHGFCPDINDYICGDDGVDSHDNRCSINGVDANNSVDSDEGYDGHDGTVDCSRESYNGDDGTYGDTGDNATYNQNSIDNNHSEEGVDGDLAYNSNYTTNTANATNSNYNNYSDDTEDTQTNSTYATYNVT